MKMFCLGNMCDICNTARHAMIIAEGENAYKLSDEEFLEIYKNIFVAPLMRPSTCYICECVVCECTVQDIHEPAQRSKKAKKTFRAERATPVGEGNRWKAVEKITTTWGSPADKARKRAAMRVKQQRKWRDVFVAEADETKEEKEKIHKIREPVYDRPCKPNFVEYTGKGWPQCEPVVYRAPKWPKKI